MRFLTRDLRFALRSLLKAPLFTIVALLILMLGIGANVAIFSVINSVLLAPLPYQDPDQVVMIWSRWRGFDKTWLSDAEYLDYRALNSVFRNAGIFTYTGANLTENGEPERVRVGVITPSGLDVLGVQPIYGRLFLEEEGLEGGAPVALVSEDLWKRRFGGDVSILQETMILDGEPIRVVGILPASFRLPLEFQAGERSQVFVPLTIDLANLSRGNHSYYGVARLQDGVSVERASVELKRLTDTLIQQGEYHPQMQFEAFAVGVTDEVSGQIRPALLILQGAVALLLLIAAANLASLLLARGESRYREMAVRTVLGANRRRLLQLLLTESILLSVTGGMLGILMAAALLRLLEFWSPASLPRVEEIGLDVTTLTFALGISVATALLFGLIPAMQVSRSDLNVAIKQTGDRTSSGDVRSRRFREAMVVAELAMAVVLVIGAALTIRSLDKVQNIDLGFDPSSVLKVRLALPVANYQSAARVANFYSQALKEIRTLPGVLAAGTARSLPLSGAIGDWGLDVEGFEESPGNHAKGDWQVVSDGYFEALGIRLVTGRLFRPTDHASHPLVAVVNQTLAKRYWPDGEAVGGRLRMGGGGDRPWVTVVGIVSDLRHNGVTAEIKEKFYIPHAQFHLASGVTLRSMNLLVKTERPALSLLPQISNQVHQLDPSLPVANPETMKSVVTSALSEWRFTTILMTAFGILAMVVAIVGVYGVIAYQFSRRTLEIGIRMALGAGRGRIFSLVLGRALLLIAGGVAVGIMAAFGMSDLLASQLYEVSPADPWTLILAPFFLAFIALLACYVPAWRATRISPLRALRFE